MQAELQTEMANVDAEYTGRSDFAKGMAKMPYAGQLAAIKESYGDGLDDARTERRSWPFFRPASCPTASICWMNRKRPSRPCARWGCSPC